MDDLSSVISAVHRIATRLFARPGLDELLPEALEAAMDSVGALAGSIWLHDPQDDTLVARHVIGGAGEKMVGFRLPAGKGVVGDAFVRGHTTVVDDANTDTRHVNVSKEVRTDSMVCVPLRNLGGRAIGALQVLNKRGGGVFSRENDVVVLETLGSLAATAIENAQQAERERKAAVADAVGDIAHDIKNMMTPVDSWASTLEFIAEDSRAALDRLVETAPENLRGDLLSVQELFDLLPEAMEGIRDGAQQAKDRGAEIADALKGNVRDPVFVVEDPAKTVHRVVHTLREQARGHGVDLSWGGDCRAFPHDRSSLFNAVYNLTFNAIPYVPPGGAVTITLSECEPFAEFAVKDTGAGMPEHIRASLFTDKTISTTPGGTGLGTQIVARVARAHGGHVTVESEPGKGSTFRLRIPLERPAEKPDAGE